MRIQSVLITSLTLALSLGTLTPFGAGAQTLPSTPANQLRLFDLFKQGKALIDAGKYDEAVEIYRQALSFDGKNARIFSAVGYIRTQQGAFPDAIAAYRQAIAIDPRDANFYYAVAFCYANMNDYGNAIRNYEQAI